MASSSNERKLKNLVINKVDSQATFDQMKKSGLINTDELYLIKEGTKDRVLDVIVNSESTVVNGISEFNVPTVVSELENDSGYITTAEETDPVFSASAAAGITSNDIQNWNNKTSSTGTITGVSVNGTSIATSGVANITSVPASILTGAIPNGVTATTQTQSDNSTKIATTAYVDTAIGNLPEPMVFKGSLGTGGTITVLPTAEASNEGHTYKVIKDGTYAGQAAKIGDTFISTGSRWELIPSGDEPSGTVTSITLNATSPIAIDNSAAITTSGIRTISHASSGVSAGTYKSVTVNSTGHVTSGTNPTTLNGYGITDAKIANGVITLGSNTITPLTEHQDITGKQDKITSTNKLDYSLLSNTPTIPSEVTESTVSGWGFTKNSGTYSKPSTGIPKTDLANEVQTSLGKADSALQSYTETDPVFSASAAAGIKSTDITNWNGKTSNKGTVTSVAVKMNNTTKGTVTSSGTIDLGTVITEHQDISGKQDKLTTQTAYSAKGSATKVPQITTNTLGQVTGITEVTIAQPTVNNATLTIQKNGTNVATFGANASSNVTANITVPTVTDTYSASSSDAMSGKAVASALSSFSGGPKNIKDGDGTGSVYTSGANKPTADHAFAEGLGTQALIMYSHAEGCHTISNGSASHAEGYGGFLTALDTTVHTVYNNENKTIIIKGVPSDEDIVNNYIIVGQAYLSADGSAQQANKIKQIDVVYGNDARTIVYFKGTPPSSITSLAVNAQVYLYLIGSLASGQGAHVEGDSTIAIGRAAHAEGYSTIALEWGAHSEGKLTVASEVGSHAEGLSTTASGARSHAEGNGTRATGEDSHAEGLKTISSGYNSHAEGNGTIASGTGSHAEGYSSIASGSYSHAEGFLTEASGSYQHVQGQYNIKDTSNKYAHIVGNGADNNNRANAHTLDWDGNAWFAGNIKIGGTGYDDSNAKVINAISNLKDGDGIGSVYTSEAIKPTANYAFAEGYETDARGVYSHAEGSYSIASGQNSHAEGYSSIASGQNSHVENGAGAGSSTTYTSGTITSISSDKKVFDISGMDMNLSYRGFQPWGKPKITAVNKNFETNIITLTFEEAVNSYSVGQAIQFIFDGNQAIGDSSHAEGIWTIAAEKGSHAEGYRTSTNREYQHVQGELNAPDSSAIFIIGNGYNNNKSNAMTVQHNGSLWVSSDIKVGGTKYDNATATVLTSENFHQYVDAYVQEILNRRY